MEGEREADTPPPIPLSREWVGEPSYLMGGLIPAPCDHDLSRKREILVMCRLRAEVTECQATIFNLLLFHIIC